MRCFSEPFGLVICVHRPGNFIPDASFVCVLLSIAAAAPEFRVSNPPLGDSVDQSQQAVQAYPGALPPSLPTTTKSVPELRLVARIVLFPCATVSRLREALSLASSHHFHTLCRASTIVIYQTCLTPLNSASCLTARRILCLLQRKRRNAGIPITRVRPGQSVLAYLSPGDHTQLAARPNVCEMGL